jgi:hypothetical protein
MGGSGQQKFSGLNLIRLGVGGVYGVWVGFLTRVISGVRAFSARRAGMNSWRRQKAVFALGSFHELMVDDLMELAGHS